MILNTNNTIDISSDYILLSSYFISTPSNLTVTSCNFIRVPQHINPYSLYQIELAINISIRAYNKITISLKSIFIPYW